MAALSGQITVTTAGTAVQGPATPLAKIFGIKAHPDNTDTVWVGSDGAGDVTSSNGFPLDPGEGIAIDAQQVSSSNLSAYWFDADVSGEKVCWVVLQP